jgi:23S rRNA A2030 N6-methylase RlmJ
MNYRHAYHAGNFADCFKHALLVVLLDALARSRHRFSFWIRTLGRGDTNWALKRPDAQTKPQPEYDVCF